MEDYYYYYYNIIRLRTNAPNDKENHFIITGGRTLARA
jgi:hypothetical protein